MNKKRLIVLIAVVLLILANTQIIFGASKPSITTDPSSVTTTSGKTATFKVAASGSGLKYQWQYSTNNGKTWNTWSGKTSTTAKVTATSKNNGVLYRCVVSNSSGKVTSKSAKLTVAGIKPTIRSNPASVSVTSGNIATFKVVAAGSGLKYQWQYSTNNGKTWNTWSGKTSATAKVTATSKNNGVLYRCVVSNGKGKVVSSSARLVVPGVKPSIRENPSSVTAASGKTAAFKVVASGSGIKYQWQYSTNNGKSWSNWSGKTSATAKVTATANNNGVLYRCIVKNGKGKVISSSAKLTVSGVKPKIRSNPVSVTVDSGKTATFKVAAAGSGLKYQWQYSTNGGKSWTNWSGKTSATAKVTATANNNGLLYRCVVSNGKGKVTSSSAKLNVYFANAYNAYIKLLQNNLNAHSYNNNYGQDITPARAALCDISGDRIPELIYTNYFDFGGAYFSIVSYIDNKVVEIYRTESFYCTEHLVEFMQVKGEKPLYQCDTDWCVMEDGSYRPIKDYVKLIDNGSSLTKSYLSDSQAKSLENKDPVVIFQNWGMESNMQDVINELKSYK